MELLVKAKQLVAQKFNFTNWAHLCATYSKRGRIVPNEVVEECMLMYHKLKYHENLQNRPKEIFANHRNFGA